MQCNGRAVKIVLVWFVKEVIMATRHAVKYRRSPYPQATRISVKNIWLYAILSTGERTFWHSPQDNFFFFAGVRQFLLGGTCPPHSPPYFAHRLFVVVLIPYIARCIGILLGVVYQVCLKFCGYEREN